MSFDEVLGLPPIDAKDATDRQLLGWFGEDIFQCVRSDGSIIDVGWYPAWQRDGEFYCLVIAKADSEAWAEPVEEFRTKLVSEAREWVLARTVGAAGETP